MRLTFRKPHAPPGERIVVPEQGWPALVLEGFVDDNGVHAIYPSIRGGGFHSGRPAVIDARTCMVWAWALLHAARVLRRRNAAPPPVVERDWREPSLLDWLHEEGLAS